jgi:hypothetical protein
MTVSWGVPRFWFPGLDFLCENAHVTIRDAKKSNCGDAGDHVPSALMGCSESRQCSSGERHHNEAAAWSGYTVDSISGVIYL